MATGLKAAQIQWLQNLVNSEKHCDAVAVVGAEETRIPIHRVLLANISEPFDKMLFGEFSEGVTREVRLPDMKVGVFRCIQQSAVGLDSGLNAETVVPTLLAAERYMISSLMHECARYMREDVGVKDVLTVMTSSLQYNYSLPEETEQAYWATIVAESNVVLQSQSFLLTDYRIIKRIVQLDEFGVEEDRLWARLLEWATATESNPDLVAGLASFSEQPAKKRQRTSDAPDLEQSPSHQRMVLNELIEYVRFPVMSKAFFLEQAATYLSREQERNVLAFHLLQRKSTFSALKRVCEPSEKILPIVIDHDAETQKLAHGTASWSCRPQSLPPCRKDSGNSLTFQLPASHGEVVITEVEFVYVGFPWSNTGCAAGFEIHTLTRTGKSSAFCEKDKRSQIIRMSGLPADRMWKLQFTCLHDRDPKLQKLVVKGKVLRPAWAAEAVRSRTSLLSLRAPLEA